MTSCATPDSKRDADDSSVFSPLVSPYRPLTQLSQSPPPSPRPEQDADPATASGAASRKSSKPNLEDLKSFMQSLTQAEETLSQRQGAWSYDNDAEAALKAERVRSLMHRYRAAKSAFISRRMKELAIQYGKSFDGKTFQYPKGYTREDGKGLSEACDVDKENTRAEANAKHADMLAKLSAVADDVQSKSTKTRTGFRALRERRAQVQSMVNEYEQKRSADGDHELEDDEVDVEMDESSSDFVSDEELQEQNRKREELKLEKVRLQEEVEKLAEEKSVASRRAGDLKAKMMALYDKKEVQDAEDQFRDINHLELAVLDSKIAELDETSEWYKSLRIAMEELSGMSIIAVENDPITQHMLITVCLVEEHQIQIELEEHGKKLKVTRATWLTPPKVSASSEVRSDNDSSGMDEVEIHTFELSISPLDDLVEVAKSMLQPPHDLRFILREALFRIRNMQDRVDEISDLRQHVLTQVDGDKVICSLKEGIIIVLRLYESIVKVEQVVGVSGWKADVIDDIKAGLPDSTKEHVTVTSIVQNVCDHIERLKMDGNDPKTPRLPLKKAVFF